MKRRVPGWRSTLRAVQLGVVGAALTGVVAAAACSGEAPSQASPVVPPTSSAAAPMSEALSLVDFHDCWTSEAPSDMRGEIPGHVVVVADGEAMYGGARVVGLALEQVFDGADHGLLVIGFCR